MSLASYHCSTPQYIIVAHSRIELLFQDWESCVLADRRIGHILRFHSNLKTVYISNLIWCVLLIESCCDLNNHLTSLMNTSGIVRQARILHALKLSVRRKRFGIILLGCSSKEPQNNEVLLIKQWTYILSCPGKFIKVFAHLARTSTTKMNHKLFFQNNKSASLSNNLSKKSFIQLLKNILRLR